MSKILEKIAPEIKIYKYLGKAIEELKETFERNWAEKGIGWKIASIDFMISKMQEEVKELDEAMSAAWGDAFVHSSLIYRLEQVLLEWKDCALVALMGIDRTMLEIEALRKRTVEDTIPIKENLGSDGEHEIIEESVDDLYANESDSEIEQKERIEDYNGC